MENDYKYDSGFSTIGITIDKTLTIEGNGHVIDALGQSRIFYITSPTVTLNNITFKNGYTIANGGAILFISSVSNSTIFADFINNSAYDGGAIFFDKEVSNSTISGQFIGNIASYIGGAIFFSDVSNCNVFAKFINNSAPYGGAISFWYCDVSNCSFSGEFINNFAGDGGAILIQSCDVSNCSFSGKFLNNVISDEYGMGGAIKYSGGVLYNCSFSGEFIDNIAPYLGGAIFLVPDDVYNSIISNSIFLNNNKDIIYGGNNILNDNCWFGNNASNYESKPYSNCVSWLFLDGTGSPVSGANGKYTVVFTLDNLYNSSSKSISHPDISDLPDVVFELSAVNGYLNKYSARPGESVIFTSTVNKDGIVKASYNGVSYSIKIINLKIDAPDVNKYYNGSERFVVTLTDSSKKPVPNTNVSITIDGKTTKGFSNASGQFSIPLDLNPGNYTVTTTSMGINAFSTANIYSTIESTDISDVYNNVKFEATILNSTGNPVSNKEIKFKINNLNLSTISDSNGHVGVDIDLSVGNYIITTTNPVTGEVKSNRVDISKANSTTSISSETFAHGVTLTANVNGSGNLTGEVVFTINGNTYYNEDVVNSKASITLINLDTGNYTAKATFSDNNHNPSSSDLIRFYVGEYDFDISAPDVIKDYVGPERFNVTLTMNNVPVSDAEVKINLNNVNYTKITDKDGKISMDISDLDVGVYGVVTSYQTVNANSAIIVNQLSTKTTLSFVKNSKDNVTLNAVINQSSAKGEVIFTVNGKDYSANVSDSKASVELSDLDDGNYTAKAVYKGDINHKSSVSNNVLFIVESVKNNLTLNASTTPITVGQVAIVVVEGFENATGNASARVGNGIYFASINDGIAVFRIQDLIANDTALISYPGDDNYNEASTSVDIIVNPVNTNITLSFAVNGNNVTLTADVSPADLAGEVVFNVNGENYTAKIADSKATYVLANLEAGSYVANAFYAGNATHKSSQSNEVSFNISEDYVVITAPDLEKYYHGPERFVVTLTDSKGNPVTNASVSININGNNYTRVTDDKGIASMAINLNSGVYEALTKYNNSEVKSTITIKETVSGENVTKMFRNGTQYYATFYDTKGNTLANGTAIEFNINGVFYTRYTNEKGVARMNINLNPGEYIITAKNPNSTEQYTNIITVLPSIVEVHDLTKYYKNASKLTFRLLDDQGNPVGAGVSANININGVFYTRQTNASGYINMNINLNPGTYIATLEYNGLMASSTVKVLPILEAKDVVMKYKDGTKFEAKLLDGQGNPFAGQSITFNINGVFYNRPTDENGIARLAINLMAGEYIITSMYEPNGAAISNKVTVRS